MGYVLSFFYFRRGVNNHKNWAIVAFVKGLYITEIISDYQMMFNTRWNGTSSMTEKNVYRWSIIV
jgi:hypothetical protein